MPRKSSPSTRTVWLAREALFEWHVIYTGGIAAADHELEVLEPLGDVDPRQGDDGGEEGEGEEELEEFPPERLPDGRWCGSRRHSERYVRAFQRGVCVARTGRF